MARQVWNISPRYLLQAVKELGVKAVFGIPGDMVIRFFKLIEDDPDVNLYTSSHEPGVGFAAIGSARATRRPGVACVTYGAGGLNLLNSVACAYAEKTPLIVISGAPGMTERAKHVLLHHTVKDFDSQLKIYGEVTQEAVILDSPRTAYEKIHRALVACREYMLPVYIEIPTDIVDQEIIVPRETEDLTLKANEGAVQEAADEILLRVNQARAPVILAGVETDRFDLKNSVLLLSRKLNLPIVTAFLARDVVPEDDPNYFGTYLGLAGNPTARKLVEESDCLLMFGVIISDVNLGIRLRRLKQENLILCVSRDVRIRNHVYVDVPLTDLVRVLLEKRVETKSFEFPPKPVLKINRGCKYTDRLVTTKEIIDAINWFFGQYGEMPIISDMGDCIFITTKIKTDMVMASPYYASMGFATPAAIGYAVTTGRRPMVLLGDGAFQMTGQEMCHCPRYAYQSHLYSFQQ